MRVRCERRGHRWIEVERRAYIWPAKRWSSVADEVREQRTECRRRRCDAVRGNGWREVDRYDIQSLSMSAEQWDVLRERGILVSRISRPRRQ